MLKKLWFFIFLIFCACLHFYSVAVSAAYSAVDNTGKVDFVSYQLRVTPDIAKKQIRGQLSVAFIPSRADLSEIHLLAPNQTIYNVEGDGMVGYSHNNGVLTMMFVPGALQQGRTVVADITYVANPRKGVVFGDEHLFTQYHTAEWLLSHDDIGDKATIETWLTVPEHYKGVAAGDLYNTKIKDGKKTLHYKQLRPRPIFTFGFAAGDFKQTTMVENDLTFRFLYLNTTESQIKTMFADVGSMGAFFSQVSGKSFKHKAYTYVVTETNAMQEASGFSLVGRKYVDDALDDKRESWLAAHELAHEWWGNGIGAKSWQDFWLNEGLVQYIVAEYKGMKYGQDEYAREISLFKESLMARQAKEGVLAAVSPNQPISFETFYTKHRSVVYSKGAYVFHMLKQHLGDSLFWQGLQLYSTRHWENVASSKDLQRAFEYVAGRSLDQFFDTWVYRSQDLALEAEVGFIDGQLVMRFKQTQDNAVALNWKMAYQPNDSDEVKFVEISMDKAEHEVRLPMLNPPKGLWLDGLQFLPVEIKTKGLGPYAKNSILLTDNTLKQYFALQNWLNIADCQADSNDVNDVFKRLTVDNHRIIHKAYAKWQSDCG